MDDDQFHFPINEIQRKKILAVSTWFVGNWFSVLCMKRWPASYDYYQWIQCLMRDGRRNENRNEMWKWLLNLVENNRKIAFAAQKHEEKQNVIYFLFCNIYFVYVHLFALARNSRRLFHCFFFLLCLYSANNIRFRSVFIGKLIVHETHSTRQQLCWWRQWLQYIDTKRTYKGFRTRNKPITFHCRNKNIIMISHFGGKRQSHRKYRWENRWMNNIKRNNYFDKFIVRLWWDSFETIEWVKKRGGQGLKWMGVWDRVGTKMCNVCKRKQPLLGIINQ